MISEYFPKFARFCISYVKLIKSVLFEISFDTTFYFYTDSTKTRVFYGREGFARRKRLCRSRCRLPL